MSVNENPVFSGLVKINTISADTLNGKPCGWYVREKADKETGKSITLEFGIYLTEDIFLAIPVHFSMKNMFIRANIEDPDYNYYQVPNNVQFGVATYTNKKTGNVSPMLVSPNEKHPPVFLAAYAYAPKTIILGVDFNTPKAYILKRYFDKDRTILGFIAFTMMTDDVKIETTIREGILNATTQTVQNVVFNVSGCATETDTITVGQKNATEFIRMPMYVTNPPKEAPATEGGEENSEKADKPQKKRWTNNKPRKNNDSDNKDPYRPYHQKKRFVPATAANEAFVETDENIYKKNRYERKKARKDNNED